MTPHLRLITEAPHAPATEFVDAMSALASGVVLVTCWIGDRPWGMTVTAFASVSADPPTVLVALGSDTASAAAISARHGFGVSLLADDQIAVARYGSAPGAPRFLESFVESDDGRSASPVVGDALAHLDCELTDATRVGDHTVFFGRVRQVSASGARAPLVYHGRSYRTLAEPGTTHPQANRSTRCLSS